MIPQKSPSPQDCGSSIMHWQDPQCTCLVLTMMMMVKHSWKISCNFSGISPEPFLPPSLVFQPSRISLPPPLLSITSSLGAHWQQQPRNSKLSRFRSQRFHCERGLTEAEIAFAVAPRLDLVDTGPSTGGQDQPRPLLLASSSSSSSSWLQLRTVAG